MNPATQALVDAANRLRASVAAFLVRVGGGVSATDAKTVADSLNAQADQVDALSPVPPA